MQQTKRADWKELLDLEGVEVEQTFHFDSFKECITVADRLYNEGYATRINAQQCA